ncbi:hypothetical protein Hdeb2414_s0009g00301011 [Helianthus debilis subsp. tardiflorus]
MREREKYEEREKRSEKKKAAAAAAAPPLTAATVAYGDSGNGRQFLFWSDVFHESGGGLVVGSDAVERRLRFCAHFLEFGSSQDWCRSTAGQTWTDLVKVRMVLFGSASTRYR